MIVSLRNFCGIHVHSYSSARGCRMTSDACKQLHFIVEEFVKISLFVELMSGWINELFTT